MSKLPENKQARTATDGTITRRDLCRLALIAGVGSSFSAQAQTADRQRPQPGDLLVFDGGEHDGTEITVSKLVLNAQPLAAFPKDPVNGTVRNRNRLNRVMVMRLDDSSLDDGTRQNSAAGCVAYSAVCTHTGCDVFNWKAEQLHMACPCHESEFAVTRQGLVVGGPAPRPLAMLPLATENDRLQVAGEFSGRIGFQEQF